MTTFAYGPGYAEIPEFGTVRLKVMTSAAARDAPSVSTPATSPNESTTAIHGFRTALILVPSALDRLLGCDQSLALQSCVDGGAKESTPRAEPRSRSNGKKFSDN